MSGIAQTYAHLCRYRAEMDCNVAHSLAISNLIYLIQQSLHDPAKALSYGDLADERMKAKVLQFGLDASNANAL